MMLRLAAAPAEVKVCTACVWSRSLSFEGADSDFGPYLSHLDFCVILLVYLTFVQFIFN